jgi:hypothetical protein
MNSPTDSIDEDEVGNVEDRRLVVHQPPRRRQLPALVGLLHDSRPEGAELHPYGRRSRTAVEAEGHRPVGGILHAVAGVGDVEDGRLGSAVLVFHQVVAGGRRVVDLLAVEGDGVLGLRRLLLGHDGRFLLLLLLRLAGLGRRPFRRQQCRSQEQKQQEDDPQRGFDEHPKSPLSGRGMADRR